ncbi:Uncharacterized protein TCM_006437 [Theobroma cacao]|uniref:Uncharacterized protein n=1 Tax=Theobroma cacao TaxID=3641 RepID=A0A061E572_THECC|nr:Uncharacterized protein TCM_006437 [Theobroma cacao]
MREDRESYSWVKASYVNDAESGNVAVINVMYKLAANDGINLSIVMVYRLTFAAEVMVPLALIYRLIFPY